MANMGKQHVSSRQGKNLGQRKSIFEPSKFPQPSSNINPSPETTDLSGYRQPQPGEMMANVMDSLSTSKSASPPNYITGKQLPAPKRQEREVNMASVNQLKVHPRQSNLSEKPVQKQEESIPNQTGLPDNLKTGIENLSGYSLDNVRVHYNSSKPAQLRALAYTQGTDIHVAPGQEKHLPHEAWHVVQQMQGRVKPTMQMKGKVDVNDDAGLEKEADEMGVQALTAGSNNTPKQLKSDNGTNVVQRLPEPGVGIEMESNTIKLVNEKRESDDMSLLGGHELKGQSIYPNEKIAMFEETEMWSLTAESTGYNPKADTRQLAVEIIVHGGGPKKGVKLTQENKGILTKVAQNLMRHMQYWQDYWTVTGLLGGRYWQIIGHNNILDSDWGLQATSAVPLDTMQDILSGDDRDTATILPDDRAAKMVSVSQDVFVKKDFPDVVYTNKSFLGLMSLICSYANGAKGMTSGHQGVKHLTPIMPRTNFVGMLKSLPDEVKDPLLDNHGDLFVDMAHAAISTFGVKDSATFHWEGLAPDAPDYETWLLQSIYKGRPDILARSVYQTENRIKLKVTDWIKRLAIGTDLMAELDLSNRHGQIGGIRETVEHSLDDDNRKAPVFEFRDAGSTKLSAVAETFAKIEREVRKILGSE